MKKSVWVYIVLGVSLVLWGICVLQVVFWQKALLVEPHVGTVVSYSSTYNSSAAVHVGSSHRHTSRFTTVVAPPRVTMQSTSMAASAGSSRVHTTSSQRPTSVGGAGGSSMASNASGRKSSRSTGVGQASVAMPMPVLLTSASLVKDGTTASETYARMTHGATPKTATPLPPGVCEECHWEYDPIADEWVCTQCGCNALDGCDCASDPYGPGYCWCPIGDGWQVWLMMAALAAAYAVYKKRTHTVQ